VNAFIPEDETGESETIGKPVRPSPSCQQHLNEVHFFHRARFFPSLPAAQSGKFRLMCSSPVLHHMMHDRLGKMWPVHPGKIGSIASTAGPVHRSLIFFNFSDGSWQQTKA